MKKSEMILSIASDIVINKPHINFKEAQELAEITLNSALENKMLPPPDKTDVATRRIVYCYYNDNEKSEDRLVDLDDTFCELDYKNSILWEVE